jgi:HEAT repeat protein/DNA-directed RNA polymerase subunit RPC12/RpoP
MSFSVLCPRCRRPVTVQESMAGQPARCPYCASAFQVPARPQPPIAATPPQPPVRPTAVPRKPAARPRKTQTLPMPRYEASSDSEPARQPRTMMLGLIAAGIVFLLLTGLVGIAAFLMRDRSAPPPPDKTRETPVAEASPRRKADTADKPSNKHVESRHKTPPREDAPSSESPTLSQPKPKQTPPTRPTPRREETEEDSPPAKPAPKSDPPVKTETSKPIEPAKVETKKPEEPVKVEAKKPEEPAKVETVKTDPPAKIEATKMEDARPAARALKKSLQDDDPAVRQSVAVALGKLGPDARDQVRAEVFAALDDTDAEVRLAVLEALANLGPPARSELPALLSALHSSLRRQQFKACLYATRSLAKLGPQAKEAVPDLRSLLQSEERDVRAEALLALRKIGSAARDAAADLRPLLKDADRDLRIEAALALVAFDPALAGAGKDAASVLVLSLRPASKAEAKEPRVQQRIKEVSAELVKLGEPVVDRLLRAIDSDFRGGRSRTEAAELDALARESALKIIAEMGSEARSQRLISALAELQRIDPSPSVREAARQAFRAVQKQN